MNTTITPDIYYRFTGVDIVADETWPDGARGNSSVAEIVGHAHQGQLTIEDAKHARYLVRCANEREGLLATIENLFTLFVCDTLSVPVKQRTWHVMGDIQGALDHANRILAQAEKKD